MFRFVGRKYKKVWELETEKEHLMKETAELREHILKVSQKLQERETHVHGLESELRGARKKLKKQDKVRE